MARAARVTWPTGPLTVFFDDVAGSTTLSKAVAEGRIRRLAPKIYTADVTSDPADIVRANPWRIVARLLPAAVIVDRSAAEGGRISNGLLFVAAETPRKKVSLPGLEIRIRSGHAIDAPIADSVWPEDLRMASAARTLLDNLAPSRGRRGHVPRTLSRAELEDWLAGKTIAWGPERTERLRAECNDLAKTFPGDHDLETVDALFDQLQGLEPPRRDAGEMFKAFTIGTAWDERRIELFDTVIDALTALPWGVPRHLPAPEGMGELPFYESYFSNYIEGTEFTLAEARTIIETQVPPADRPEDGHDILGTYHCVVDPVGRSAASTDTDELIGYLRARHQTILAGRPDKNPGEWKVKPNQVGVYQFVAPELVEGTLRRGLAGLERPRSGDCQGPVRDAVGVGSPPVHRRERESGPRDDERGVVRGRRRSDRDTKRLPQRVHLRAPSRLNLERQHRRVPCSHGARLEMDGGNAMDRSRSDGRPTRRDQRVVGLHRCTELERSTDAPVSDCNHPCSDC